MRASVELWSDDALLGAAQAKEADRIKAHIVYHARLVVTRPGRAVMVRYLRDGELYSQVVAADSGEVNPSICLLPKLTFEAGDSLEIAFAGLAAHFDPQTIEAVVAAGSGAVSFDLHITDPATGLTTTHHCTGKVQ